MKSSGTLLIAVSAAITAVILALAGSAGPLAAQTAQSTEPIEVAKFPYIEIFSPTFFWSDEADFVRTGSTTCPKGRAITGGLSILQGKASKDLVVSEIMTPHVFTVEPDDSVEACMAVMTERKVRHLPVVDGGRVVGVVSIGDAVKALLREQQFVISQLEGYITA